MFLLFLVVVVIGFVFYLYEQKNRKENEKKIEEFVDEVRRNSDLNDIEKKNHIEDVYIFNGYSMLKSDAKSITVSKKEFSFGAAMMWFGLLGAGVFIYIAYYLFFKQYNIETVFIKGHL